MGGRLDHDRLRPSGLADGAGRPRYGALAGSVLVGILNDTHHRTSNAGGRVTPHPRVTHRYGIAIPNSRRTAATNRVNAAASPGRGGAKPQIGLGHSGTSCRRATMWTCSCGTTLPIAAILILSQAVTALSTRETRVISPIRSAPSSPSCSISVTPVRRGTRMSQG